VGLPAGGIWSGSGIVDPNLGIFYPQFNGGNNFSVWLSYTFNSCVDSVRIQGIQTKIVPDTLPSFCNYDAPYSLNFDETGRTPGGGIWSGNGITNSNANGVFTPSVASEGYSWLYYTANSCPDSVLIEIYPLPNLQDTTICIEQSAFIIPSDVLGGIWSGPGIVNPTNGTFLASLAGIGTHTIIYQTPHDCYYALQVTVDTLPIISLSGLPNLSCLVDTNYVIQASPLGGIWSGAVSDSLLNPLTLGTGVHTVQYTYGLGDCAVSSSISIQVLDTLKMLSFFEDTIVCPGTYVRVGATASGGDFLHYQFQWEDGFGGSSEILVQVDSNQQYILNLEDGCSEGVKDTFQVNVYPSFEVSIETSDSLCFGTEGWIKAAVLPNASYSFIWDNNPQFSLDSILGEAGSFYDLEITDNASFCKKNFSIQIPSFTAIMADFLTIPQDECLDLLHPELYIIDQSIGGLSGIWSFGDGSSQEYVPNANVYHEYLDTGIYQLVLQIENEGSCVSEHEWQVCVVPKTLIIAPTAFSPNLDGANDEFIVRTIGATKLVLQIYDRWGNLVYKTDDLRNHWDGNYKGDKQAVGTYAWTLQYYSLEEQKENIAKGSFQLIR
jgi:gliding motility-associated-like protein